MTEIVLPNIYDQDEHSIEIQSHNLNKVVRKGDKIYYTEPENVTNVDGKFERRTSQNSDISEIKVENVDSGESLYKTFSFETNKDEAQKCIAFWRSVVEKNLKPMKCTIVESLKEQQSFLSKPETPTTEKPKSAKAKHLPKSKSKPKEKKKDKKPEDLSKWAAIFKDLQKKRLDEIRLIAQRRCSFCEAPSADLDDHKKENARENKRNLNELDTFEPKFDPNAEQSAANELAIRFAKIKSKQARKGATSDTAQRGSIKSKDRNSLKQDEKVEDTPDNQQEKGKISDLKLAKIKQESEKYKLVDAISSKEKSGAYSKWRQNKTEKSCKCASEFCRCNINPAVISYKQTVNLGQTVSGDENIKQKRESPDQTLSGKGSNEKLKQKSEDQAVSVEYSNAKQHEPRDQAVSGEGRNAKLKQESKDQKTSKEDNDVKFKQESQDQMVLNEDVNLKTKRDLQSDFDEGAKTLELDFVISSQRKTSVTFKPEIEVEEEDDISETTEGYQFKPFRISRDLRRELFGSPLSSASTSASEPSERLSEKSAEEKKSLEEMYFNSDQSPTMSHFYKEKQIPLKKSSKKDSIPSKSSLTKLRRSLSVVVSCTCGEDDCDCKGKIENLTKEHEKAKREHEIRLPEPSADIRAKCSMSTIPSHRDSFENIYRRMSVSQHNLGKFRLSTVSADSQGNVQFHRPSEDETVSNRTYQ